MKHVSSIAAVSLACLFVCNGAEFYYKNNAYTWEDNSWEGGVKPGTDDTAVIPGLAILKTRYDSGRMQSNSLTANSVEEVGELHFRDLYGINVNGTNAKLLLGRIVCADMSPDPSETAQVATNKVSMHTIKFKNATNEIYVGTNHVFHIGAIYTDRPEGSVIEKTGIGTLIHNGNSWEAASGTLWIKEGEYIRSGNGYPEFRGDIIVGGAGKPAALTVEATAAQTLMMGYNVLDIRPQGRVTIEQVGKYYYHETLKVDHGVLDGGGTTFCMNNQAATDYGTEYTLDGGIVTNATLNVIYLGTFTIKPSAEMSAIYGKLSFTTAYDIDVPDGSAPVDFLVSGDLDGANRGINKAGAGTMVIRCADTISTWGGMAGKAFNVKGGELFIESSETGIGMGTNNVIVASGATYGGVGRHVGGYVVNRGDIGNLTFDGGASEPSTFAIGRKNEITGALEPGKFILGSEDQAGNVTFSAKSVLKVVASRDGVSELVVNGLFTLSGDDTLAIEGPADADKLPPGDYTLVATDGNMNHEFAEVTYNGGELPAPLKVRQTATTVELHVPHKGLVILVR